MKQVSRVRDQRHLMTLRLNQRTVNIYSHIIGAILFTFLPLLIFGDAISPRWTTASTSDIVVCSIYALGVTVCFVLSTAYVVTSQ